MLKMQRRSAFTMVELIFVIIILGILASMAVAKFLTTSEQAKVQICNAAVGTMNRTIGETLWSKSVNDGNSGSVKTYATDVHPRYIEWPEMCGGESAIETVVSGTDTVVTVDGLQYDLTMIDGTSTTSPQFGWKKK